jgi:enoyl-CoA hydratase/carnithine racemase
MGDNHLGGVSDSADPILYEKRQHIAYITLNRPDRGNALTQEMHTRMRSFWDDIKRDPDVRCVIVTGAGGRHFSTGADVGNIAANGRVFAADGPMTEEVRWSSHQNHVWKPVIAAVNGLVAGAGLHVVVDADVIVAAEHATFMDTHVNVGFVGAIENIGLSKRLPLGQALRMTLQGRSYRLSAQRAYQLGMVDELVPLERLMPTAEEIAREISKNSPHAVSLSKQAIWGALEMGYRDAQEYGWALLRMHWAHPDFREGPRAFAEKREPKWLDE